MSVAATLTCLNAPNFAICQTLKNNICKGRVMDRLSCRVGSSHGTSEYQDPAAARPG